MSKSFFVNARNLEESIAQGVTQGQSLYSATEGDGNDSVLDVKISSAGTFRNPAVKIATNTLSGDFTATLYVNDAASTCKVTVTSGTGWTENTSLTVAVSANDDVRWVVAGEAGTGAASYDKLVVEFQPDTAGDCLSVVGINDASSSQPTADSTNYYFAPFGSRKFSTTEADLKQTVPIAGTIKNFNFASGLNSRTTDTVMTLRVNGADGNGTLTFASTDDSTGKTDTVNTDSVSAGDELTYEVATGTGSGETLNLEKAGINLVNTSDLFFVVAGSNGSNAGSNTYYWPLSGPIVSDTEAINEIQIPDGFDVNVERLFVKLLSHTNSGDIVFTLRKNNADTSLTITASSGTDGYLSAVPGATLSVAGGDTLAVKSVHAGGASSLTKLMEVGVVLTDAGSAPVLSLPTETAITDTTATVGCTTDYATGTLYWYVSTSASAPSSANLKSGSGSVDYGSQASPGIGTETFGATGLSSSTNYYTYFIHNNATGDSSILGSGVWATAGVSFPAINLDRASTFTHLSMVETDVMDDGSTRQRVMSAGEYVVIDCRFKYLTLTNKNTIKAFLSTNRANAFAWTIDGIDYSGVVDGGHKESMTGPLYNLSFKYYAREV